MHLTISYLSTMWTQLSTLISAIFPSLTFLLPPLFGIGLAQSPEQLGHFEAFLLYLLLSLIWSLLISAMLSLFKIFRGVDTQLKRGDPLVRTSLMLSIFVLTFLVMGIVLRLRAQLSESVFSLALATLVLSTTIRTGMSNRRNWTGVPAILICQLLFGYLGFLIFLEGWYWQPLLVSIGFGALMTPSIYLSHKDGYINPREIKMLGYVLYAGMLMMGILPIIHALPKSFVLIVVATALIPVALKKAQQDRPDYKCFQLVPVTVALIVALLGLIP